MFKRDHLPFGISMGILFPLIGVGVAVLLGFLWQAYAPEGKQPVVRERTLVLLAICLNLIPFRAFNRKRFMQSTKGVVMATLILGILWVVLYGKELLG